MKTIDCTPTWQGILPGMLAVLNNPDTDFESRKTIEDELKRMAELADERNDIVKEQAIEYLKIV